eukprot:TRINITY_DN8274_c0_g1_i1.p1 TRINITY_DN8274_c0_g1~~TRINITY_DN8274_c0_g1_i1.p1  ORF type:complete len:750 (+),score=169.42 TRINITY_DN8274_c0_g1_i1:210-2459(+)
MSGAAKEIKQEDGSSGRARSVSLPWETPLPTAPVFKTPAPKPPSNLPPEVLLTDNGTRLKLSGFFDEGEAKYREALAKNPRYAPAHYNLGVLKSEQGKLSEALDHYEAAVNCNALYIEVSQSYCNMGVIYKNFGNLEAAIAYYDKAIQLNPNFTIARNNMAISCTDMGTKIKTEGRTKETLDEGIRWYKKAITYNSSYPDAYYNLGVAYAEKCEFDKALVCYELATHFNPRFCEAYNNMGVIYKDRDNFEKAIQCYQAALAVQPTFSQTLNNLGVIYTVQGKFEQAFYYIRSAIAANPDYAEAYNNLGVLYRDEGLIPECLKCYEKCISLNPLSRNAGQNRLLALNYLPEAGDSLLEDIYQAHKKWGELFQSQFHQIVGWRNKKDINKVVRVGYLSPDFFTHSVSYFAESLLANHSKKFRIYCYSSVVKDDAKTHQLKSYGHVWRNVHGMPAHDVAAIILEDEIDILVELAGHTAGNRLDVMALKPAPVQVTYIGYPNTTGLKCIDYRIADYFTDSANTKQKYTETLIRLPNCFLCYTPIKDPPAISEAPVVKNGFVTFGTFNNLAKITNEVLLVWAKILKRVPGSRLIMKCKPFSNKETKDRVAKIFEDNGIESSRLDLIGLIPLCHDHLTSYSLMDISLDPWPYAGTTTTCESLFMGVPVISYEGANHAWNVGKSLLNNIGLGEFVAKTDEQYVDIAVNLGTNPKKIQETRSKLRDQMLSSALCNGPEFIKEIEKAYFMMWESYCKK